MAGQREINANFPGERLPRVLNVPQDAPYFSAFAFPRISSADPIRYPYFRMA